MHYSSNDLATYVRMYTLIQKLIQLSVVIDQHKETAEDNLNQMSTKMTSCEYIAKYSAQKARDAN